MPATEIESMFSMLKKTLDDNAAAASRERAQLREAQHADVESLRSDVASIGGDIMGMKNELAQVKSVADAAKDAVETVSAGMHVNGANIAALQKQVQDLVAQAKYDEMQRQQLTAVVHANKRELDATTDELRHEISECREYVEEEADKRAAAKKPGGHHPRSTTHWPRKGH